MRMALQVDTVFLWVAAARAYRAARKTTHLLGQA